MVATAPALIRDPAWRVPLLAHVELSEEEMRIAWGVATGQKVETIAARLGYGHDAVDKKLQRLRDRLGVETNPALVFMLRDQLEAYGWRNRSLTLS